MIHNQANKANDLDWLNHPDPPATVQRESRNFLDKPGGVRVEETLFDKTPNKIRAETPLQTRERRREQKAEEQSHRERIKKVRKVQNDYSGYGDWTPNDHLQRRCRLISKLGRMALANDFQGVARVVEALGREHIDDTVPHQPQPSALTRAVSAGNSKVVRALLQCGADPLQDYRHEGITYRLLLDSIDGLQLRTAAELLAGGADTKENCESALKAVRERMGHGAEFNEAELKKTGPLLPPPGVRWPDIDLQCIRAHGYTKAEELALKRSECKPLLKDLPSP